MLVTKIAIKSDRTKEFRGGGHTMLEVELDIVTADVGSHGDDRGPVELANKVASRNTIQIGHDNVHENKVIFGTILDLIHRFQAIKLQLCQSGGIRATRKG